MRVLVPDAQFDDDALLEREVAGDGVEFVARHVRDAADLPDREWAEADALYLFHEIAVDAALVAKLERCRIIVRAGVGYDRIDLAATGAAGIPVCNVPDYGTTEVADHAIALMLALRRGIAAYDRRIAADPMAGWDWRAVPTVRRLRGRTFGVIGLGRIGTAAARRARGLDMDVLFYDPHLPDGADLAHGHERVARLEELLERSDVVSLHCPHTAETDRIIDAAALARMQRHAVLVNTARGRCVDTAALADALARGTIAGAGLDVLPMEPPLPGDPLVELWRGGDPAARDRLVLTPHAAWFSPEGQTDLRRRAAATIVDHLRHGRLRNVVNGAQLGTLRDVIERTRR